MRALANSSLDPFSHLKATRKLPGAMRHFGRCCGLRGTDGRRPRVGREGCRRLVTVLYIVLERTWRRWRQEEKQGEMSSLKRKH
ncbi:hypothetical protein TGRUB_358880 [Toxoplasma gondii RUB]|uniref:Uncharacterized protein n=2 Tax=Toxoplasma gondii TaxID=5811 RepID=A0A086LJ25_TOXGO|nr:hypothetical protein TGP89_358880 [Toxoplasma gondii p89]KFG56643.1 hypothetical protein TGRUB_358880 [Toxoplasma gondii RUB]